MEVQDKRIGELLIQGGFITLQQLQEGLEVQKTKRERICSILMDLGHLTEKDFFEFLHAIPGTASIDLSNHRIDPKILRIIRYEFARRLELIPLGKIGNALTVAMVCPLDNAARKELEHATGLKVRPLLSSRTAVLETLDKHYGTLESEYKHEHDQRAERLQTHNLHSAARLVAGLESLPTFPDVLNLISSIAKNPNSSTEDLADVIASDGSMTAKILKLANAPAFGMTREISNLSDAIEILGLEEARTLAVSLAVYHRSNDNLRFDFKEYQKHSLACATLAKWIALDVDAPLVKDAFVAGLLHDMGKVVLATKALGKLRASSSHSLTGLPTELETIEKALGLAHPEVGYHLAENWLLPLSVSGPILYHHTPELDPSTQMLSMIVFLANVLCKLDPSQLMVVKTFDEEVQKTIKSLGISERVFAKMLEVYAHKVNAVPSL